MNWKNLPIEQKFTFAFGTVISLTLLLGVIGMVNVYRVQQQTYRVAEGYLSLSNISNDIAKSAQRAVYAQRGYWYTISENFRLEGNDISMN